MLDEWNYPRRSRDVTGLNAVGLPWLTRHASATLAMVGDDAKYVAGHIAGLGGGSRANAPLANGRSRRRVPFMKPIRVILLPGSVLPADEAFGPLVEALGPDVQAVAKDLELYADDEPRPGWSLDTEVDGVLREADALGWETFHLLGYSGGGAAALAFAAKHPDRLLSLALLEPAWAGNWDWSPAHAELWKQYEQLETLPPEQFMPAFIRLGVRHDVVLPPPPPGPQPPWMAKRPAGIKAFLRTFKSYHLDRARLAAFQPPVFFALGGLSNPDDYGEIAARLARVFFPDFHLEVFPKRHHFDPPHRIEPKRLAELLRRHWEQAETG